MLLSFIDFDTRSVEHLKMEAFTDTSTARERQNRMNNLLLNWFSAVKFKLSSRRRRHQRDQNFKQQLALSTSTTTLTLDTMNQRLLNMQYAVQGPILTRANELEKQLAKGAKKPFERIIRANIGDCHAGGQKPITFMRQVLSLVLDPSLLQDITRYPSDARQRALRILSSCHGSSVGSYNDSAGIQSVREDVARFIADRDGGAMQVNADHIFLTTGATDAIKLVLALVNQCTSRKRPSGVMIPVPRYPLYSAIAAQFGMHQIDYELDENNNWELNVDNLQRAYELALKKSTPRVISVINPGNPTGSVLSRQNIEEIIRFARQRSLLILADEVYQENVYSKTTKFISVRQVLHSMGAPYSKNVELISVHSTSKGFIGECGLRGGYMECVNISVDILQQIEKCCNIQHCSTVGQAAVAVMVNPPQPHEPSYAMFQQEKLEIVDSLARKARIITDAFNSIEGYQCNEVQGAMYAFPSIHLPVEVIEAAENANLEPDCYYALSLLEQCGICIVPGSGFGQKSGTFHFRTTILPSEEEISDMLEKIKRFHIEFIAQHCGADRRGGSATGKEKKHFSCSSITSIVERFRN